MKQKVIFFLLVFCSFLVTATAQKAAKVKSFTLTTDHISGSERRKDLNGTFCALVKIQVVDNIERIEGNKIGSIVNRGVEKWVYMCKGSRNMKIHLKNHLPLKVMFQNYKINGLESNRVYEMLIEIPDAPVAEISATSQSYETKYQKLIINYTPTTSMVLVDSKPHKGNGTIELKLPIGEHSYIIASEGYSVYEGTIKLNEQAPSVITANLISDNPMQDIKDSNKKKNSDKNIFGPFAKKKNTIKESIVKNQDEIKTSKKPQNTKKNKKGSYYAQMKFAEQTPTDSDKELYAEVPASAITDTEANVTVESSTVLPSKSLNKTFKYVYEGISFKCKAKKGYVTITGWDVDAVNVIVPSHVIFEGEKYPVTSINTFINGNNYAAKTLTIQEGIKTIGRFAFVEFRSLTNVTIPSTIKEIGKNAFRNNNGLQFHISNGINENDLRSGRNINIK